MYRQQNGRHINVSVVTTATGNVWLEANRWDHYYQRHTYRYFDFGGIKPANSMWPDGIDLQNELDATMPFVGPPIVGSSSYFAQADGNGNHVGVNWHDNCGQVDQFYPRNPGHANDNFSENELRAIRNLS